MLIYDSLLMYKARVSLCVYIYIYIYTYIHTYIHKLTIYTMIKNGTKMFQTKFVVKIETRILYPTDFNQNYAI